MRTAVFSVLALSFVVGAFMGCGGDDTQPAGQPDATVGAGGGQATGGNSNHDAAPDVSPGKGRATGDAAAGSDGSAPDGTAADAAGGGGTTADTGVPETGADADLGDGGKPPDGGADVVDTDTNADAPFDAANTCPEEQPSLLLPCSSTASLDCTYDGGMVCTCQQVSSGTRAWVCNTPDAGGQNCPAPGPSKPQTGDSCGDSGAVQYCRYGNTWCLCNVGAGTPNQWFCP